ncbi:cupin domain-containing protein [Pseudalkalibacillus decolorationis]|uniref:cupin domain-containing protein n=1 Tax=Pseudalkalibacillus decolorationis TaxID=163879 RepID=UPI0021476B9A|nr:cupin domain-containing protein [Pseudalkalibacillus decolorationis]
MSSSIEEVLVHPDGTTITLLDRGTDKHGEYLIVEHLLMKQGAINGPHWHPILTESFTVKEGKMRFKVDGKEELLGPGQHIKILPKQVHQFWNDSKDRLIAIHEIRPPGSHWNMFKLIHKLTEENRVNSKGVPLNPLWLGIAWECIDGYIAGPPIFLQRTVFGGLARLARGIGYRI